MVVNQITQIDKNGDNQIDVWELIDALKPNWIFTEQEDLVKIWELLNNEWETNWLDQWLLSSLEQSFYEMKSSITSKDDITDEEIYLLNVYKTILWKKCEEDINEIQKVINRHNMKKIMGKNKIKAKDIAELQNYLLLPAEIAIEKKQMQETEKFIDWRNMNQIIQKPRITKNEKTKLNEYITKLSKDNSKTDSDLAHIQEIEKYIQQQEKIIQSINNEYAKMDEKSQNLLSDILWPWDEDLITKIDNYLLWDVLINTENKIKWINLLNNLIRDDFYSHEKLKASIDESVKDMMHVANIKTADIGYSQYTSEQVMAIQLWANVCHWKNLSINWQKVKGYYFNNETKNNKLTSVYLYRLEFITRNDVIKYRHDNPKTRLDELLYIPELDEILDGLSTEDQEKILMDFLSNCYLRIRQDWIYFENQIQWDNMKFLLDLAIKEKTEWDMSIDEWIQIRQQLIKNLEKTEDPEKDQLISAIQNEIDFLIQKDQYGNYLLKNMWEYYKNQYESLKQTINKQRKDNVEMNHRQHALNEWNEIVDERKKLDTGESGWGHSSANQGRNHQNKYEDTLGDILMKLSKMYNSTNTSKYREWMKNWEVFDSFIMENIALKFKDLIGMDGIHRERQIYWSDFCFFLMEYAETAKKDIKKYSYTLDIISEIESIETTDERKKKKFVLTPIYWTSKLELPYSMPWLITHENEEPTSYKLSLWADIMTPYFEWWLRLKKVYEQYEKWEINLIITSSWRKSVQHPVDLWLGIPPVSNDIEIKTVNPGELCMYEKKPNWDIYLRKYDSKGKLPSKPTKIISPKDCNDAIAAMMNAMESINTDEFNQIMREFSGDRDSLTELQDTINSLVGMYNRGKLGNPNVAELISTVATLVWKIEWKNWNPGLKDKVWKFKKLRKVLYDMQNNNWINSLFEEWIQARIHQIDSLIEVCSDDYIHKLSKLTTLKSNDEWYKDPNVQMLLNFLVDAAIIIAGFALAPVTGWMSIPEAMAITFLTTFAFWMVAWGGHYMVKQNCTTRENLKCERDKHIKDRWWTEITIPWFLPENEKSLLLRYARWECTWREALDEAKPEFQQIFEKSLKDATIAALTMWLTKGLSKYFNIDLLGWKFPIPKSDSKYFWYLKTWYKYGKNGRKFLKLIVPIFCVQWVKSNIYNDQRIWDIVTSLDTKIKKVIPHLDGHGDVGMIERLTCKNISDDWKNIDMEYDSEAFPNEKMDTFLEEYRKIWAKVTQADDGHYIVKVDVDDIIIHFKSSIVPYEYRVLPAEIKTNLSNLWWVELNEKTWEISYKNPEGLVSLRWLWTYLDMTWQWKILIDNDWRARLIYEIDSWEPMVININPQTV